jgi:hemoglobin/transferrin/lactoferrin receptor protein
MKNLLFTIVFFISSFIFSQKVKVLDYQTGKIVKNVSIFNDKQTINITTNDQGFADISEFLNKEMVVFSHLSYTILRVRKTDIKSKNYIIYLTNESEQLDEVVISLFKKEEKANRIAEQIAVLNARDIQKVFQVLKYKNLSSVAAVP